MSGCQYRISVIVPIYNASHYLERCVTALLGQSLKDGIEFVFCDDGSNDDSVAKLREFVLRFPNRQKQVRILLNDGNRGAAATRKRLYAEARGEYIIACDADDWVDATLYEEMLAKAEMSSADVVLCPIAEECPKATPAIYDWNGCGMAGLLNDCFYSAYYNAPVNKLIRSEIIKTVDVYAPRVFPVCEDMLAVTEWIHSRNGLKIETVHGARYHYVRNRCSACSCLTRFAFDGVIDILSYLKRRYDDLPVSRIEHMERMLLFEASRSGILTPSEFASVWPDCLKISSVAGDEAMTAGRRLALLLMRINFRFGVLVARMMQTMRVAIRGV